MCACTDYWFSKAMTLCYAKPDMAMRRMNKFKAERGILALVANLQANPGKFGRRVTIHASPDRQKEAKQAATLLPLLAMTARRKECSSHGLATERT